MADSKIPRVLHDMVADALAVAIDPFAVLFSVDVVTMEDYRQPLMCITLQFARDRPLLSLAQLHRVHVVLSAAVVAEGYTPSIVCMQ